MLGFRLQPWRKSLNRRLIETEKFYLFDIGLANYLARREPKQGTPEFGKSFEHYMLLELMAYKAYRNPELPIYYWRTSTGLEVDFILGDMEVAVEIKASKRVHETDTKGLETDTKGLETDTKGLETDTKGLETDTKGLKSLNAEHTLNKSILVSLESEPKVLGGNIECMPWRLFLENLWGNSLI